MLLVVFIVNLSVRVCTIFIVKLNSLTLIDCGIFSLVLCSSQRITFYSEVNI